MTFYAVENDRAVGAAIVLHAISFVPITLLGAVFMLQDGLSLTRARALGEEARKTGRVTRPPTAAPAPHAAPRPAAKGSK